MENLATCRICLAEIHTSVVLNKNLQELYGKLIDTPIETADRILACFICYTQLKQCYQLMTQCLKAEDHYADMTSENYQPNQLVNQDHFESFSGLRRTPIESINIVDSGLTGNNVVKEEVPAVSAVLDDIIEPKEEDQCDDDSSSKHFKMPRKRTRLSRQTATAKRLRRLRSNETVDENMHRLATQRVINEQTRATRAGRAGRARESSADRA